MENGLSIENGRRTVHPGKLAAETVSGEWHEGGPPEARAAYRRPISSSEWHSTKNENAGVKEKPCFTTLSVHDTVWSSFE